MLAVHFGAGNIGRGFIGQLLHGAGYEVCFVDVNGEIINELNRRNSYTVVLADKDHEEIQISNVRGINSMENPKAVTEAIAEGDIVTTAVGANILPIIAKSIAEGVAIRLEKSDKPLNIIACENMINGSSALKEAVFSHLTKEQREKAEKIIGFPNAAVDRIVPLQSHDDKLLVSVEPFFEWVINKREMTGQVPVIEGVTYVEDLLPYIERKLFTVNTGHAATAYLGSYYGLSTIKEAITNSRVRETVEQILRETGQLLVKKYGFDQEEHQAYITKILGRFENEYISDDVTRVARSPIRKIGANDRFVKPARELLEFGVEPVSLAKGIALALMYRNADDIEAVELQGFLSNHSVEELLVKYSDLGGNKALIDLVVTAYGQLVK